MVFSHLALLAALPGFRTGLQLLPIPSRASYGVRALLRGRAEHHRRVVCSAAASSGSGGSGGRSSAAVVQAQQAASAAATKKKKPMDLNPPRGTRNSPHAPGNDATSPCGLAHLRYRLPKKKKPGPR